MAAMLKCSCLWRVFASGLIRPIRGHPKVSRYLTDFNDQRDFELTELKNIKIRAEVVIFIPVCPIAAFNVSTARYNVTHLHKNIFVSRVSFKESLGYMRD